MNLHSELSVQTPARSPFRRTISALLAILMLLAVPPMTAASDSIYQASVRVDEQSQAVRDGALRHTLGQVLVRVTGDLNVTDTPQGQAVLSAAPRLVQVFRYERGEQGRLVFVARFDQRALQRELRAQGLPVWGAQRPQTIAWIAQRNARGRGELLDPQQVATLMPSLTRVAGQRGVPLLLPRMDMEDRAAVNFDDVWSGVDDSIATASSRYAATHQLVGRISRRAGRWVGRWSLLERGRVWLDWEQTGVSMDAVAASALHEVATRMAERYALVAYEGGDARTLLRVAGVASLDDYARVSKYLSGLNPVSALQVVEVRPDSVLYALNVRGGDRFLDEAIALGRVLRRETNYALDPAEDLAGAAPAQAAILRYRLAGAEPATWR